MEAAPLAFDRYVIPALPGLVVSCVAAVASWIRATSQRATGARIAEALKEALAPLAEKLDELKDAISALDKTLAVQEQRHLALVARVDSIERDS